MTAGRAAAEHDQRALLMYEEGFRWWNLGYAAAVAFVLFAHRAGRHGACSCAASPAAGGRVRPPACAHAHVTWRWSTLRADHAPAARSGWSSVSFMPPGEASALPAAAPAAAPDAGALPRAVRRRSAPGATSPTASGLAVPTTLISLSSTRWPATPSPSCASPAATASSARCSPRSSSRARWRCCRCSCMLKELGLVNTYAGVIVPGDGEHLRHLPGAPVRARRFPTSCSTRRASTAPASCASSARSCCRCCGRSW